LTDLPIRVLIVDDEEYLLELSRIFLERSGGIHADVAISACQALDKILLDPYDVIVSDYQMPSMDGLALLSALKRDGIDIPFILFTGKSREDIAVAALNMGAAYYIQKGGDPKAQFAELANMVRRAASNKNAERRLIESETKFRTMFTESADAFLLIADGKFIDCNKAAEALYMMPRENLIGSDPGSHSPVLQPDGSNSFQKAAELVKQALRDGSAKFEWVHVHNDGKEFWVNVSLTALNRSEGGLMFCIVADITDRKRAEEAVKASENRFRSVVANSEAVSFILDSNGRFTLVEGLSLAKTGFTPDQLIGTPMEEVFASVPEIVNVIRSALSGKAERIEASFRGRRYDAVLTPTRDERGKVDGVIGIANDITESSLIDQERKRNATRMQALLELNQMSDRPMDELAAFAMEEAVSLTDSTIGYLAFMNEDETVLTMHAWSRQAMRECDIRDRPFEYPIIKTGLWGEAVRQRRPIITNDYSLPNEMKKGIPPGHVRLTRHMNVPIFDSGKIVIVAGVGNKATEYDQTDVKELTLLMEGMWRLVRKKRMEEALRESEKRMSDIIDLLPDPTMVVSHDGFVVAWNKAMEGLTGTRAEDVVGKGNHEYALSFYGERRPLLIDYALSKNNDVLSKYSSINLESNVITAETISLRLKGKDVILWARASPFYDQNGNVIGAIETIRDVTDWKRAQSTLLQMNKQLSTLSDITRHDILNTLTVLRGHVALARTRSKEPMFLTYLNMEDGLLQKIEDQIKFTKEYQNIGLAEPSWQNLEEMIDKLEVPPGIKLLNECGGIEVFADPMLPRVFYNLLDNSMRHGGKTDMVTVRLSRGTDSLRIVYEDNGNGIAEKNKDIIFMRGYGKNTGLGLFLAREILALTNMRIVENGREGEGARFEITVPKGFYRKVLEHKF